MAPRASWYPLLALTFASLLVSATQRVSLELTGSTSVSKVENLSVTTTVTNIGDETLKLLKDPSGALSNFATNKFNITGASGGRPAFTGVKIKFSPETAARLGSKDSFTILLPGESTEVIHDLSEAYDFTSPGEGTYHFSAASHFYVVGLNNRVKTIHAESKGYSASVSGKLVVERPSVKKLVAFEGCNATQQALVLEAAAAANVYAAESLQYLLDTPKGSERYTTWFGEFDKDRYDIVVSNFASIGEVDMTGYKYDCTCDEAAYAYVYVRYVDEVYLCDLFWKTETTGTDSRGGTLVHESTHWERGGGTFDYAYGQEKARWLALAYPSVAWENADSYEYLAENQPLLL